MVGDELYKRRPCSRKKNAAQRRARAAFCWGLTVFLALTLGYHVPLSVWFPEFHDVEYGRKLRHLRAQLQRKAKGQPFVLGLGSSFTGMALRPDVLIGAVSQGNDASGALVYNYGINNGGCILEQMLVLRRLLAEGIRPDLVLIETYPPFYLGSTMMSLLTAGTPARMAPKCLHSDSKTR
jgi:hypothetical protein